MGRADTYNTPTPAIARARRAFEARLQRERGSGDAQQDMTAEASEES